jgi:LPS O-antigen subunit length determinant protein (WzzB/FepE family)
LDVLWVAKKRILVTAFAFAVAGLAMAFILPQKWTSKAVITPAEQTQWNHYDRCWWRFRVLDVDVKMHALMYLTCLSKIPVASLLEEYMTSSPFVMAQLEGADVDPVELHRAVVNIAEEMKAADNTVAKDADKAPYASWTLSFTAPTATDARTVLEGYIQFVSALVEKETMQNIRNQVTLKTRMEKQQLELDRFA